MAGAQTVWPKKWDEEWTRVERHWLKHNGAAMPSSVRKEALLCFVVHQTTRNPKATILYIELALQTKGAAFDHASVAAKSDELSRLFETGLVAPIDAESSAFRIVVPFLPAPPTRLIPKKRVQVSATAERGPSSIDFVYGNETHLMRFMMIGTAAKLEDARAGME